VLSLRRALAYQHPGVLRDFLQKYQVPVEEARELFREMKKWLWLLAEAAREKRAGGSPPPLELPRSLMLLDEMWHTFILFTADYTSYCLDTFGAYIHHYPATPAQIGVFDGAARRNPAAFVAQQREALVAQYRYIDAKLGRRTLLKWQSLSRQRFTPEFVARVANPYFLLRVASAVSAARGAAC
jgi:hypothetical protein